MQAHSNDSISQVFSREDYFPSMREVAIGAYPAGDNANFIGLIDEVQISNEAIYKKNFFPQRRFEVTKETLALLRFNETGGEFAFDDSGKNKHGVIHRPRWTDVDRRNEY